MEQELNTDVLCYPIQTTEVLKQLVNQQYFW